MMTMVKMVFPSHKTSWPSLLAQLLHKRLRNMLLQTAVVTDVSHHPPLPPVSINHRTWRRLVMLSSRLSCRCRYGYRVAVRTSRDRHLVDACSVSLVTSRCSGKQRRQLRRSPQVVKSGVVLARGGEADQGLEDLSYIWRYWLHRVAATIYHKSNAYEATGPSYRVGPKMLSCGAPDALNANNLRHRPRA
jgi:hypothetical protein